MGHRRAPLLAVAAVHLSVLILVVAGLGWVAARVLGGHMHHLVIPGQVQLLRTQNPIHLKHFWRDLLQVNPCNYGEYVMNPMNVIGYSQIYIYISFIHHCTMYNDRW